MDIYGIIFFALVAFVVLIEPIIVLGMLLYWGYKRLTRSPRHLCPQPPSKTAYRFKSPAAMPRIKRDYVVQSATPLGQRVPKHLRTLDKNKIIQ